MIDLTDSLFNRVKKTFSRGITVTLHHATLQSQQTRPVKSFADSAVRKGYESTDADRRLMLPGQAAC